MRCLGGCAVLLFLSIALSGCQTSSPGPADQGRGSPQSSISSGSSGAAKPSVAAKIANPSETVAEISTLILSPKTKGSGVVTIIGKSSDCSPIEIQGSVNVGRSYRGSPSFSMGVVFLPGVTHEFTGHVCLPTLVSRVKVAEFKANVEYPDGADVFGGGVLSGPVSFRATASLAKLDAVTKSKAFQIDNEGSNPLVLRVTLEGYKYVSGGGTLLTPSGTRFSW